MRPKPATRAALSAKVPHSVFWCSRAQARIFRILQSEDCQRQCVLQILRPAVTAGPAVNPFLAKRISEEAATPGQPVRAVNAFLEPSWQFTLENYQVLPTLYGDPTKCLGFAFACENCARSTASAQAKIECIV